MLQSRPPSFLGLLPTLTHTRLLLLFTMPGTAAAPGPVAADLPVLQTLLMFVEVVNFLTLFDITVVEGFLTKFFGDAADRSAGVPLGAALREVW